MASYMSKTAYSYAQFQRAGRHAPCRSAYPYQAWGLFRLATLREDRCVMLRDNTDSLGI
jgi:hypothetical protein